MKRPQAILLDLDNTVYAYAPCHRAGLEAAHGVVAKDLVRWQGGDAFRSDYGRARSAIKQRLGRRAAAHCRLLYFKAMVEHGARGSDLALARALHEAYWQGYFSAMQLDAGCAGVLASWQAEGIALAWVTNFTTERQMSKLTELRLDALGALLITSEEAGAEKPDPATLALALEQLGFAASDACMIGDDPEDDRLAARACGVPFIHFARETSVAEASAGVVRSWPELGELVDGSI